MGTVAVVQPAASGGEAVAWKASTTGEDEIRFPTRGFSGLSLRLYDPQQDLWTIYWCASCGSTDCGRADATS
jgi:hypothetical protein